MALKLVDLMIRCKCCNCYLFHVFAFMFDGEVVCHHCFWWAFTILEEGNLNNDN